uniref:Sugar phosphate transporter domain-containing protein n=1 Tax=Fibrocapsa japonica TaxID=94617 RepID=A0A7S2V4X9_9STRA|mmetsp:Transcript_753/g.1090  ORF Transcript_753/g.1090 Transcript_753/m.1090 type:complete len:377 (+) Transcript_753:113-1243(+)|eukprot:CAMPEP_0113938286 /NCGR_PEP_ID=MMETSP1339-20121228/4696_1 /TAXON_ID=94617 /ORGANISM="Fibrocapsa japonica" /LENGTH=376 /DNA_ID=CAMNT_0000941323 /DNA_START=86 /DNA_END=1216 /DNA_ORIENTATION=- /assembly_acc=CAM_ASM_000762
MFLDNYCLCGPQLLIAVGVGVLVTCIVLFIDYKMFARKFADKEKDGAGPLDWVNKLPSGVKLFIAAGGIYGCFLTYGVKQEKIYSFEGEDSAKFTATLFLLLFQCTVNAAFAALCLLVFGGSKQDIPQKKFAQIGASYIGAMLCSNEALKYVNYPTQALGKSCKMIPVMLLNVVRGNATYSIREYAQVLLITLGIAAFQLAGKTKSGGAPNSPFGLFLLFLSLSCDGLTGSTQDGLRKTLKSPLTVSESMLYTNAWAVIVLIVANLVTGQFMVGLNYLMANTGILEPIMMFSLTSALGQVFIFFTVNTFGSLVTSTVTTTRKFFTVLFSVVMFGHTLTTNHWIAVLMVFVGLGGEVLHKYEKQQQKKASAASGKGK